jgi:hypothetical protein
MRLGLAEHQAVVDQEIGAHPSELAVFHYESNWLDRFRLASEVVMEKDLSSVTANIWDPRKETFQQVVEVLALLVNVARALGLGVHHSSGA